MLRRTDVGPKNNIEAPNLHPAYWRTARPTHLSFLRRSAANLFGSVMFRFYFEFASPLYVLVPLGRRPAR